MSFGLSNTPNPSTSPMSRPVYLNGVLLGWCYRPLALVQALRQGITQGRHGDMVAEVTAGAASGVFASAPKEKERPD